jgi:N-acetylglucosamine kinase-like BadF-type ATPase
VGGRITGDRRGGRAVTAEPFAAVLALDAGNSKTDAALVAADGTLLASARGPGVPSMLTRDQAIEVLGSVARLAAANAGLPAVPAGRPIAQHLSACVANADLPEEEEELGEGLRARGWTGSTEVANDTFAVLWAGLDGPGPHWGVAVTCGAGINCVGVAPDGRVTRFLSLGQTSGDWGGGYGLGLEATWWAIRAEDGRGPQTALREAVPAHFGLATMYDVAVAIHKGNLAWDAPLGLVRVLFEVAGQEDDVALDIVHRLAGEVCVMAVTAMRRLGLGGQPVPVALGGGVLTARDPVLTAEIAKRLAEEAPMAEPRIVDIPPVAGAALLGLDRIGAPGSALARLRDAYRPPAARS